MTRLTHKSGYSARIVDMAHTVRVTVISRDGSLAYDAEAADRETAVRWATITIRWLILTEDMIDDAVRLGNSRRVKQECRLCRS